MKSKKSKKKKKIILACLSMALLILIIVGLSIFSILSPHELNNAGLNNIYTNVKKGNEEENKFMILDPNNNEGETEKPPEEAVNEVNEGNTVQPEKPKTVNSPYYIKVNNLANVVTIYKKDKNGNYTVPARAMICSVGAATPESGVYTISDQYEWRLLERKRLWSVCIKNNGNNTFPFSSVSKER